MKRKYFNAYRPLTILLASSGLAGLAPISLRSATFTNPTAISLPVGALTSPYPALISVSGLVGEIVRVSVTLQDVTHVFPDDLDILLVGPAGQKVLLMSDAGGGIGITKVDLTFSDAGGSNLPDSSQISSGSYRPTDYPPSETLPTPAPAGPYGTNLTAFTGTNPNGTWQLYVNDDSASAPGGSIGGGWILDLTAASPPVITAHPQSQTVAPGATAVFKVAVTGTPPLGYRWLRNGQIIVPFGQGKSSLTISNVHASDAGTYSVVVTNIVERAGVLSSNALLTVLGPLVVLESPQNLDLQPGKSAVFRIAATGTPPLLYQWKLNGALLAGQTNSMLTLSNVQAESGGRFTVTVLNDAEAVTSEAALLVVHAATDSPPSDRFSDRPRLLKANGLLQGNSAMARTEPGEPIFPGGGKSVWCELLAPADGILTLAAQGSAFDTLLSVFTGTVLSNLTLITRDDDGGGFYTSHLRFNVQQGTRYQVALDGFGSSGTGGDFSLSWVLEKTLDLIPEVITVPEPQSVLAGSNAIFSVLTSSRLDTFQWFHGDTAIRGATSSVYTVSNADSRDVGLYSVLISNRWGRVILSQPVNLELGSDLSPFSQLEYQKAQAGGNRPAAGFVSIALGGTVWKKGVVPPPGPAAPCGTSWGSLAQPLHAEDNGVMLVSTKGSSVSGRLSVYQDYHDNFEMPIACGPPGNPSVATFVATQGSNYTVEVEGTQAGGNITLSNFLGSAPPLLEAPIHCFIAAGDNILLSMPATNWVPVPKCQWRLNGEELLGATNLSLFVKDFSLSQTGAYSVVMSNFVRAATNTVAYLDLAGPLVLGYGLQTNNGTVNFLITATNAPSFVLVTKTDLDPGIPWQPFSTNQGSCLAFPFTNANALTEPRRFFRAVPWLPAGP